MRLKIHLIIVPLFLFSCSMKTGKNSGSGIIKLDKSADSLYYSRLKTPGVVIVLPDSIELLESPIIIQDPKGNVVNKVLFNKEECTLEFSKNRVSVRGYYPDYSVIIFDGYPLEDNKFKVIINDSIFYMQMVEGYTAFEKWEDHMKRAFIVTNSMNPLRESPKTDGRIIPNLDYESLSFVVLHVDEDWIYVKCNIDCEGCPNEVLVSGWLRWRKEDELLVRLFYSC